MLRRAKILGTGSYLPRRVVPSTELDLKLGLKPGTVENTSGVKNRRYVDDDETTSRMGALAAMAALENAHVKYDEIDAIISTSGTYEQPIPCNAALIQKALGKEDSGIACFDLNSTCLSFAVGMDMLSYMIDAGRYRKVLLVSSEIASVGLNWKQLEACSLFGDGAVAVVLGRTPDNEGSKVLSGHQATYSAGSDFCEITGGGTRVHPRNHNVAGEDERFLFKMDGRKVYKMVTQVIPEFLDRLLKPIDMGLNDFKMIIPHQASTSAMELMRRRLKIAEENWMSIIAEHGNMIAASIPLALHKAIEEKRIERGDKVLMIGTSAGFTIGGLAFEY
jgi:3-oxoacyl-[acyl-carrier-protein] synthase-3